MVFLALATRLVVVWYTLARMPTGWLFTRGLEMDFVARSLLAGEGFSSPYGPSTGPTAMISPAYPFFIAGVFRIFGVHSVTSALVVLGVHIALNLATAWLILFLARRFAQEDAALLVAAFWCCSPPMMWMPTVFWETSFSTCFLLGFVALALGVTRNTGAGRWIACGCACAVAGLFNPALLPSAFALFGWAAYKSGRAKWHRPALALAAFLLLYSSWPLRNARVFHAFIPTRSTFGYDLWMGNRPGADGSSDESLFPSFNPEGLADYKQRGEMDYFAHKEAQAKEYIGAHPDFFARLTLLRIARYWTGTGNRRSSVLFALHATTTTLFGLAGLIGLLRSRWREGAVFFAVPLALFPLPYYVSHAEFKYRLIVDPLLCVLAAHALQGRRSERRFMQTGRLRTGDDGG